MPYPPSLIGQIADRHGLSGELKLLPKGGMVNEAWAIGECYILRIVAPDREPECDTEAQREAAIVPLLIEARMTTPRLVAFDASTEISPRPYTIYERAKGELLGFAKLPYHLFEETYRQVGRELYALHQLDIGKNLVPLLRVGRETNVPKWISRTLEAGSISDKDAVEIAEAANRWIELGGAVPNRRLVHNDIHPWNLMVEPDAGELTAILDWGDATFGDPAADFAAMPLQCVPSMFEGYVEAGGALSSAFIARALVEGLNTALWEIRSTDIMTPERPWWRMPPGGWPEMKSILDEMFPELS